MLLKYLVRVIAPVINSLVNTLLMLGFVYFTGFLLPVSFICFAITMLFSYHFFLSYFTATSLIKILCLIPSFAIAFMTTNFIAPHLFLLINALLPAAAFGILSIGIFISMFELLLLPFRKDEYSIIKLIVHPSHRTVLVNLLNRANIQRTAVENEARAQHELALPETALKALVAKQKRLLEQLPKEALAIFDQPEDSPEHTAQTEYLQTLSPEQQKFHKQYRELATELSPKRAECCLSLEKPAETPDLPFVIVEKLFKKDGIELAVPGTSMIYLENSFLDGLSVAATAVSPTSRDPYFSPRLYPNPNRQEEPGYHTDTSCPTRYIYYPYTQVNGHTVSVRLCETIENFLDPTLGKEREDSLEMLKKRYEDQKAEEKARGSQRNDNRASTSQSAAPNPLRSAQQGDYRLTPPITSTVYRDNPVATLFYNREFRDLPLSGDEIALGLALERLRSVETTRRGLFS